MKSSLVAAIGVGVAIPAVGLFVRYRRDISAARARLAAVERRVISTQWGAVEYAERGGGDQCSWCMGSSRPASGDSSPSATSLRIVE